MSVGVGILDCGAIRPIRRDTGVIRLVRFLIRTAISACGVLLVAYLGLIKVADFGPGSPVTWSAFGIAALFALVLGVVNAIVKPIVQLLALPLTILTLGLFSLLVNLGMFYLAAAITPWVQLTAGFWLTAVAAIIVALVNGVASSLTHGRG